MRLNPAQLSHHLQKQLLPVYLVSGDEPLQLREALEAIRRTAQQQGYNERERLIASKDFDWTQLAYAASSQSLFADKRILELHIPNSPGQAGAKTLLEYTQRPPADTLLLIQTAKIDKRSQAAKWFKALDQLGAVIQIWPIKAHALPAWIQQRLAQQGLHAEREAATLLAERVEGHLLAAAQEVEKLALLYGQPGTTQTLSVKQVIAAVANSARYSVYDLVDAATGGESARCVKMLCGLRDEGVASQLVLWALSNEIRALGGYAQRLASGEPQGRVLAAVWDSRKPRVSAALARLPQQTWGILLQRCAQVDQIIKGLQLGREWDQLLQICLGLAGVTAVSRLGG